MGTESAFVSTDRNFTRPWLVFDAGRSFEIPVLPQTRLFADLILNEPRVDLEAVSQVVLSDLGATLRILRARAQAGYTPPESPFRMTDCLAEMGLQECWQTLEGAGVHPQVQSAVEMFWMHCREIACWMRDLAANLEGIGPGDAYLVGLCHAIHKLPSVLNPRGRLQGRRNTMFSGRHLVTECGLPEWVVKSLSEACSAAGGKAWSELLRQAHDHCMHSIDEYTTSDRLRPEMLRAV